MPRLKAALAVACLLASAGAARAGYAEGRLPDGVYHCEVYLLGKFISLGEITIRGDVYSGPAYGGRMAQGYNYQMDANGEITWLGPLGGFTSGGNSVSLTQATLAAGRAPSFDIIMRQPDGAFTASTCTRL
jgi:hypothetical protein